MQTAPYEKASVWKKRRWDAAAAVLGVNPTVLKEVYIGAYWHGIDPKDFVNLIHRGTEARFIDNVKRACAAITWTEAEIAEKQAKWDRGAEENDFSDLMNYRLKCLIEIGDEWLCDETKTYTFSKFQYLTKGKLYRIESFRDEPGSEFGFTTTTDIPAECNWSSVHSCRSIWRDGKEIWNWNRAYLELWLEQNPDHPERQKMIDHCTAQAAKII